MEHAPGHAALPLVSTDKRTCSARERGREVVLDEGELLPTSPVGFSWLLMQERE